ncbi:hypothetical protein KY284_034579 [Solanum tuberosum]|nr:hypothetical protein KY284_034579 [Solanum tuberosum]
MSAHDELVLEADSSVAKEAGLLLQMSMENAVSLLVCAYSSSYGCVPVPLHVKLKIGSTWGSLEPFQASNLKLLGCLIVNAFYASLWHFNSDYYLYFSEAVSSQARPLSNRPSK